MCPLWVFYVHAEHVGHVGTRTRHAVYSPNISWRHALYTPVGRYQHVSWTQQWNSTCKGRATAEYIPCSTSELFVSSERVANMLLAERVEKFWACLKFLHFPTSALHVPTSYYVLRRSKNERETRALRSRRVSTSSSAYQHVTHASANAS